MSSPLRVADTAATAPIWQVVRKGLRDALHDRWLISYALLLGVLGVVAALLCQGLKPPEAAALGAYLHGKAGDLAAERLGAHSVLASDITDSLPGAFLSLNRG